MNGGYSLLHHIPVINLHSHLSTSLAHTNQLISAMAKTLPGAEVSPVTTATLPPGVDVAAARAALINLFQAEQARYRDLKREIGGLRRILGNMERNVRLLKSTAQDREIRIALSPASDAEESQPHIYIRKLNNQVTRSYKGWITLPGLGSGPRHGHARRRGPRAP